MRFIIIILLITVLVSCPYPMPEFDNPNDPLASGGTSVDDSDEEYTVTDPNLVAYYPLDSDFQDHSGYNNHGTPSSPAPIFVTDRSGSAASAAAFNGLDQYAAVSDSASLKCEVITVTCWARIEDFSISRLFGKWQGGNVFNLGTDLSDQIWFEVNTDQGQGAVIYTVPDPGSYSTSWHHIAGRYDGNEIHIYIDGVLVQTAQHRGVLNQGEVNFEIARCDTGMFTGVLDEVRIFNYALSQAEIQADMNR
ncbi:MAG: LamG domain-containing protein [Spirochaetia bacterium]